MALHRISLTVVPCMVAAVWLGVPMAGLAQTSTMPAPDASEPARATPRFVLPAPTRLQFDVSGKASGMGYTAQSELLWTHSANQYEVRLDVRAPLVGGRTLASTGQLTPEGLAPDRFSDKFRKEQGARFDRDRGKVVFSGDTPEADLLPGAQDEASVFVQLAALLAGAPARYRPGSAIGVQTIGPRVAETWVFNIEAGETLHLPGGELATLRLARAPRKEGDQKIELWLAPTLGYLPARIRATQANGNVVDQLWRATTAP